MNLLFCLVLGYLAGSIPTGYVVGRLVRGIDIRKAGSGNMGATNVFRVVGKKWGIAVLVFDMLKGYLAATLIPGLLSASLEGSAFLASLIVGLAAVAGHTWTFWLHFHGGKGVATSLGVLLAVIPQAAALSLAVWISLFAWKRYVSMASMGMAVSLPLWIILFYRTHEFFSFLFCVTFVLAILILYTHRANLRRLRLGTERKIF